MYRSTKRILTAATVVLAASAPSTAYASPAQDPGPSTSSGQAQSAIVPSVQRTTASSPQGFQWDDAGIGAAGVLVLLGLGSGATIARRHRVHTPLAG